MISSSTPFDIHLAAVINNGDELLGRPAICEIDR